MYSSQRTLRFREQHDKLRKMVAEFPKASPFDERDVAHRLARFSGLLRMHLAFEDETLYPLLLIDPDEEISEKARAFQREMGHLSATFEAFYGRWIEPGALRAQPDLFLREWGDVVSLLAGRMDREDNDLYVMLEGVLAGSA